MDADGRAPKVRLVRGLDGLAWAGGGSVPAKVGEGQGGATAQV